MRCYSILLKKRCNWRHPSGCPKESTPTRCASTLHSLRRISNKSSSAAERPFPSSPSHNRKMKPKGHWPKGRRKNSLGLIGQARFAPTGKETKKTSFASLIGQPRELDGQESAGFRQRRRCAYRHLRDLCRSLRSYRHAGADRSEVFVEDEGRHGWRCCSRTEPYHADQ